MNRADEPNQLALFEPCPICLRLTPGRSSGGQPGIFTIGHEACYAAARRWQPGQAARFDARNPRASAAMARRVELAARERRRRADRRAGLTPNPDRVARAGLRAVAAL